MKKLIFLLCAFAPVITMARMGTDQGNGGNIKKDALATPYEIRATILDARIDLFYVSNYLEYKKTSFAPIGFQQEKFREALRLYPVVTQEKACLDENGNEVDGSVSQFQRRSYVCISTSRLEKKVRTASLRAFIFGLVAHEYFHLVGASETEAQEFQKAVVRVVSENNKNTSIIKSVLELVRIEDVLRDLSQVPDMNSSSIYMALRSAYDSFRRVYFNELVSDGYNLLTTAQRLQILKWGIQMDHASQLICERDFKGPKKDVCRSYLNLIYEGQNQIQIVKYASHSQFSKTEILNGDQTTLVRTQTLAEIQKLLTELSKELNIFVEQVFPAEGQL